MAPEHFRRVEKGVPKLKQFAILDDGDDEPQPIVEQTCPLVADTMRKLAIGDGPSVDNAQPRVQVVKHYIANTTCKIQRPGASVLVMQDTREPELDVFYPGNATEKKHDYVETKLWLKPETTSSDNTLKTNKSITTKTVVIPTSNKSRRPVFGEIHGQATAPFSDHIGSGDGKENIPPGLEIKMSDGCSFDVHALDRSKQQFRHLRIPHQANSHKKRSKSAPSTPTLRSLKSSSAVDPLNKPPQIDLTSVCPVTHATALYTTKDKSVPTTGLTDAASLIDDDKDGKAECFVKIDERGTCMSSGLSVGQIASKGDAEERAIISWLRILMLSA